MRRTLKKLTRSLKVKVQVEVEKRT